MAEQGTVFDEVIKSGKILHEVVILATENIGTKNCIEQQFYDKMDDLRGKLDALRHDMVSEFTLIDVNVFMLMKSFELRQALMTARRWIGGLYSTARRVDDEEFDRLVNMFRVPLEELLILSRCNRDVQK